MRSVGIGLLLLCAMAAAAFAQAANVLVSGQTTIATIDANSDGMPGAGDCTFKATESGGNITITPVQGTTLLKACAGNYTGFTFMGFSSSNFAGANIQTSAAGVSDIPTVAEIEDEREDASGQPIEMNELRDVIEVRDGSDTEKGSGVLCKANGIAARVDLPTLPTMLVQLSLFPNDSNPTHLGIPSLNFRHTPASPRVFSKHAAYIPVTSSRSITVALDNDPDNLFVDIKLDELPSCALRAAAPSISALGFIAITLALAAFGVWRLGRRPAFYESLPTL